MIKLSPSRIKQFVQRRILDQPKRSFGPFGYFWNILWKNQNEHFGQPKSLYVMEQDTDSYLILFYFFTTSSWVEILASQAVLGQKLGGNIDFYVAYR